MDVERTSEGVHVRLGLMEKIVFGAIGLVLTGGSVWLVSSVQTLVTQQAVANSKLSDLTTQLGDMPAIRRDVVKLQVQVEQHDRAISELRQTRGAR